VSPRARSSEDILAAARARRDRRAEVTDSDVVMDAAAAFLAVRPRSEAETRRRLLHLGYPAALCDSVVGRLTELGYLDDRAFARAWVESRDRARPRGSLALRRELQQKGVPGQTIDEVLADRAGTAAGQTVTRARAVVAGAADAMVDPGTRAAGVEEMAARRLLERRASSLRREDDPRKRRQKAYALLARHGFPPDVCLAVAAAFGVPDPDGADEGV